METVMKQYSLTVQHDAGTMRLRTVATSRKAAKDIVMRAEGCPPCAILSVKGIKKVTPKNQQSWDII